LRIASEHDTGNTFLRNCSKFVRLHGVMYRKTNLYSYSAILPLLLSHTVTRSHCMPVALLHYFYDCTIATQWSDTGVGACQATWSYEPFGRDTKWLRGSLCGQAVVLLATGCDASLWLGHCSNTQHYGSVNPSHSNAHCQTETVGFAGKCWHTGGQVSVTSELCVLRSHLSVCLHTSGLST
jgi:hypothetical protein